MKNLTKELKLSLRKQSPELKQNLILKGTLKRSNTPTKAGKSPAPIAEVKTQDIPDLQTSFVNPVMPLSEELITGQMKMNNTTTFQNVLPAALPELNMSENPQTQTNQTQTITETSGPTNILANLSPDQKDLLLQKLIQDNEEIKARLAVQPLPAPSSAGGFGGLIQSLIPAIAAIIQKIPLGESESPGMTQTMAQMWMQMAQSLMLKQLGVGVQVNPSAVITGGN